MIIAIVDLTHFYYGVSYGGRVYNIMQTRC